MPHQKAVSGFTLFIPLIFMSSCYFHVVFFFILHLFYILFLFHQMTADSFTIIEKAVIEHNMLASGRIYDNITFTELGSILRLDASKAEKVAARMICEDRLKASIDQTEGLLLFDEDKDALRGWDERIKELCGEVAECVDTIQQSHPHLITV